MLGKSERYLIDLLLAGISDNYLPQVSIDEVDFERVYKLCSLSRVSNIVYYALLKLNKDDLMKVSNLDSFKKECLLYGVKERTQDIEVTDIINAFNKENINIIFFKGVVLKHLYPKLDMRVSGDIDFLVEPKDINKAMNILESIGFKKSEETDFNVEVGYKRQVDIELHKKLSVTEHPYFNSALDHKEKFLDFNNTYTFDYNYHFVYLLSHAYFHMIKGGLGLKYPLDFYLYLNKYDIDFKKINNDLEKLNLDKFTKLIILLCHKWFKLDLSKYKEFISDFKISDYDLETFEIFILNGGEYGMNRNVFAVQRIVSNNKIKYLLSKIFKPFRFIVKTDNPKWWQYILLPYYYVRYWFIFFIIKGKRNINKAKAFINVDEDLIDLEKLFIKLNIKK